MKSCIKSYFLFVALSFLLSYTFAQSTTGQWTVTGPVKFPVNDGFQINGIGRVSQMKFSTVNAQRAYAVSASGGLWISNDAGLNWLKTGTDNQLPQGSCASVCADYTNENILYLSTGDANYYSDGAGIYKSINGGLTWVPSNAGIGTRMALEILIDATSHNTLIAFTTDGIWKSTDAGVTWVVKKAGGAFREGVYKPGSNTVLYAADDARFWRSTDNGDTWTQVISVNPNPGNGGRLAVTPADTNMVYVGFVGSNTPNGRGGVIYQSKNGGISFTLRKGDVMPNLNGYEDNSDGQGAYNWALGADRSNANTLYAAAHCVWKSTDGGAEWKKLTDWPYKCHTDMHQIFVSPHDKNRLFNINDGGIFVSTDGGDNWTPSCDGISASEFYHSGNSNLSAGMVGGGLQDNGEVYYAANTWHTNRGGDWGSRYAFDYSNAGTAYYLANGNRKDLATGNETSAGLADASNNDRYAMTKQNISLAFAGQGNMLRRTTSLQAITPLWGIIKIFGATIKAVTVSPNNINEVYVVLDNQQLYFSSNATAAIPAFTQIAVLPGATGSLANIVVNNANSDIVYVTCNQKIYRSPNKGISWTDITAGSPANTDIISLLNDPFSTNESFYIATPFGVYYKNNALANWQSFSRGLPSVALISDLNGYFDGTVNSLLYVSFYGRGLWQSPLYPFSSGNVCTAAFEPNETAATAKNITPGIAYSAAISSTADVDYFKIVTAAAGNIRLELTGPSGVNYNLFVTSSNGTQIGSGEMPGATETVSLVNQPAGIYFIKVAGHNGARSPECYTIKTAFMKTGFTVTDKKIINRASGKALEDLHYSIADTAPVGQWTYAAGINQLWQFTDLGNGYYKIQNKLSHKVMEIPGHSGADSTGAVQYKYSGGGNQQWLVTDLGTGYYKITNRSSGKVLDNPGGSTADDTQMIQCTSDGTYKQQWLIADATAGIPKIPSQPLLDTLSKDAGSVVSIVPNPAISQTNIIIRSLTNAVAMMQVADATGEVIVFRRQELKTGINKISLITGGFTAGTYYVVVKLNEKIITKKLIVGK
jgi:photosystem II stability/assembly factor-like uncharacterized protein